MLQDFGSSLPCHLLRADHAASGVMFLEMFVLGPAYYSNICRS